LNSRRLVMSRSFGTEKYTVRERRYARSKHLRWMNHAYWKVFHKGSKLSRARQTIQKEVKRRFRQATRLALMYHDFYWEGDEWGYPAPPRRCVRWLLW
jgi:hypothetical protein